MKKNLLLTLLVLVVFSSCANQVDVSGIITHDPYGFWGGLWHGAILSLSFIGSLFSDGICIYSPNNTGAWYDFGFLLGINGFVGGVIKVIFK